MANIGSIGHTTLDIFYFLDQARIHESDGDQELCLPFPRKVEIKERMFSLGGNAPNVGAGLINTGHSVSLITPLGDDPIGRILEDDLQRWGFDLQYVTNQGKSDSSVILHFADDRTILSYHAPCTYSMPPYGADLSWLYLSSLGETDILSCHAQVRDWLQESQGAQLLYNPSHADILLGMEALKDVVTMAHSVVLNKQEAEDLLQRESVDFEDDAERNAFLQAFIDVGINRIIITDGKRGVYMADDSGLYFAPVLPVEVAETTGAGDAFASGYLSGLAHGRDVLDALPLGVVQSASVITQPGATNGLLTLEGLDEILQEHPEVRVEKL